MIPKDKPYLYPPKTNLDEQITKSAIKELQRKVHFLEKTVKELLPTEEQLAKYPSLREAYEQFSIIKRLTSENDKT